MLVIPAIDIINGEAVRLRQGDYAHKTVYNPDPVEVAKLFESHGATWLHVVDLDGAKAGAPVNLKVIEAIRQQTGLQIEFGGGIRDEQKIQSALAAGVDRVILGTRIAGDLDLVGQWLKKYGEQIVAGIDMKDGLVATAGWEETAALNGLNLAEKLVSLGCLRFIVTDIATDGMLQGPNTPMIQEWVDTVPAKIIASGGVSVANDLNELAQTGCEAVIVGKALYEDRLDLKNLWKY